MNEDQKEKAINIALQQPLITDIKTNEKGEVLVSYENGETIPLNTSCLYAIPEPLTTTSAVDTASCIKADSVSSINGIYEDNSSTNVYHYPWTDSNITTTTWTCSPAAPVSNKKYFIEDKANFSWIVSKFMKTYVSNLNNSSSFERISFFGLKNGEEKTLSLTLKAIDTSVKVFFDLAVTTARQNSFDELFGPLTDELTEEDYIERVEDSGVFIKEFYDEKSLIELVKSHKIEISKKINHKNRERVQIGVLEDDEDDEGWFSKAPWDNTTPTTEVPDNLIEVPDNLKKDFEENASSILIGDLWRDPRTFLVQEDHVKYNPSSITCNISNISSVTQGNSATDGVAQYLAME